MSLVFIVLIESPLVAEITYFAFNFVLILQVSDVQEVMKSCDLHLHGNNDNNLWTCDLTHDYLKYNSVLADQQ